MPASRSPLQLGEALLGHARDGRYPEYEDVISADLAPSAIPEVLKRFEAARTHIKVVTVRKSSWDMNYAQFFRRGGSVLQARAVRLTLTTTSQKISLGAEQDEKLQRRVQDAISKLQLLQGEVTFSESLATTLAQMQEIRHRIRSISGCLARDDLSPIIAHLLQVDVELDLIQSGRNVQAVTLLRSENGHIRGSIVHQLTQSCQILLGILEQLVTDLAAGVKNAIITPRLQLATGQDENLLAVNGDSLTVFAASCPSDIDRVFDDLGALVRFLQWHLPSSVMASLSKSLALELVQGLISQRLCFVVPENINALQEFTQIREQVHQFAETLASLNWPGQDRLRAWINSIPQIWLQKRQKACLDGTRRLLKRGYGDIKTVERVETRNISQQDFLLTGNTRNQDWEAKWSGEEDSRPVQTRIERENLASAEEEEDVSAWGLDDDGDNDIKSDRNVMNDEEDDAWGWGDDDDTEDHPKSPQRALATTSEPGVNGHISPGRQRSERQITLKETYNITSLPMGILKMLHSILSDTDALSEPSAAGYIVASAAPDLSILPSLLLAMYRASGSRFYATSPNGSMLLYNDCLWLSEQLRTMQPKRGQHEARSCLDKEIVALEGYGKQSYRKEMESQRTIIKDLLDGAQGFGNCTEPPFAQECDLAINSIVDRIGDIHAQWKDVLSHSALLQSVGSLLSTVVDKIIIDVEDMNDISEPESQRLTAHFKRVTTLESLFLPLEAATSGQESVPLAAVYVPGWFKFQYLAEILDSSLIDIKYLWTDGGLNLEYDVEEVAELIEALFADSEHRRRAIGEIRRASRT
ncbi:MAG: hypothetical protein Q9174_000001 [Haloplaca sp. 1 TL-2023]